MDRQVSKSKRERSDGAKRSSRNLRITVKTITQTNIEKSW